MRGPALFCDTFSSHLWQNSHNYSPFYLIFRRRDSTKKRRCLDYRPWSAFRPSLAQGEGQGHDLRSDGSGKGQAVPPGLAGAVQLRDKATPAAVASSTPNSRARLSLYSLPVPSLRTLQLHPTLPPLPPPQFKARNNYPFERTLISPPALSQLF